MLKLSWEDVERISFELGEKIKRSGYVPEYVIGITSGGLIPLYFLVKQLDIRNILTIMAKLYEKEEKKELRVTYMPEIDLRNKRILLLDEITDSGETLQRISEMIRERYEVSELRSATLAVNTDHCRKFPDYYVLEEKGEWIVFPWEKEEFPEYSK